MPPNNLPTIRQRRRDAHKGDFGRVLLIGGSRGMVGSITMSAIASLRSGVGAVVVAIPDRCLDSVAGAELSLMTLPLADTGDGRFANSACDELVDRLTWASAIACGPGMGTDTGATRIVERLVADRDRPRVLDADALNILAQNPQLIKRIVGPIVLTPHPGELERLTNVSAKNRPEQLAAAMELANRCQAIIVVKGGPTVVVDGNQQWTCETGNPGMATAGSGDVLTGIVAGILAQSYSPWDAARLAIHLHGAAGDLAAKHYGQISMIASDLLTFLPEAIRSFPE